MHKPQLSGKTVKFIPKNPRHQDAIPYKREKWNYEKELKNSI